MAATPGSSGKKPEAARFYTKSGHRLRAGVVPFRWVKGAGKSSGGSKTRCDSVGCIEVMLVSSLKSVGKWILPAGSIELGETARQAALREAKEEGGIEGELYGDASPLKGVGASLGTFERVDKPQMTEVFLFRVTRELPAEEWEEGHVRSRKWFSLPSAISELQWKGLDTMAVLDSAVSALLPHDPSHPDQPDTRKNAGRAAALLVHVKRAGSGTHSG